MKKAEEKKFFPCSICGRPLADFPTSDASLHGHSAFPVSEDDCCGECNMTVVIPARMKLMREEISRNSKA